MTSFSRIEQSAHSAANGHNPLPASTHAQNLAGNYKKGRVVVHGMKIAIENPRGSLRHWQAEDGTSGSNLMKFHYGYFEGVIGADGDGLDVYLGPWPENDQVFVINQTLRGSFDEQKIMLGFPDQRTAEAGYLSNFNAGWPGLDSCVACSMTQFKWWLAYGDKSRPLTKDQLPYEGSKDMDKVLWDSAHQPLGQSLARVLYQIREHDANDGLIFEPLTISELMQDAEGILALDALVIPLARLQQRMAVMQKVLDRAGDAVKVAAMQVSDPFTQKGSTNVAVIYELSDGQTVSVFFHNPDVTPRKIAPGDDMVSWKWMLNKKDITLAVAPERGRDLDVRTVAARLMKLAEKNSSRFVAANGKRAARMQVIEGLKTEFEQKEVVLTGLQNEIAELEVELENRPIVEPTPEPEPQPKPANDEPVLTAAGFKNVHSNDWVRSIAGSDGKKLQVNIRVFGEPSQYRLTKSVSFPGITGASQEVGTFDAPDAAVTAAQSEFESFMPSTQPEPQPEPAPVDPTPEPQPELTDTQQREKAVSEADSNLRQTEAFYALPGLGMGFGKALRESILSGSQARVLGTFKANGKDANAAMIKKAQSLADKGGKPVAIANILDGGGVPVFGAYLQMPFTSNSSDFENRYVLKDIDAAGEILYPAAAQPEPAGPTAEQIANAKRVIENQDYLPWEEVKAAKELLGIVDPDVVDEFQQKLAQEDAEAAAAKAAADAKAAEEAAAAAKAAAEADAAAVAAKAAQAAQESADGDFIQSVIDGEEDFYDKAVTDRLAELARKYTDPEGSYVGMLAQAKTAAKNFFIAEFKKKVA